MTKRIESTHYLSMRCPVARPPGNPAQPEVVCAGMAVVETEEEGIEVKIAARVAAGLIAMRPV